MSDGPNSVAGSIASHTVTHEKHVQAKAAQRPRSRLTESGRNVTIRTGLRARWNRAKGRWWQAFQRGWVRRFGETSLGKSEVSINKARRLLRADAGIAFEEGVNQLVKKLVSGKRRNVHDIATQLEGLHKRSQALIDKSDGDSTPEENLAHFRRKLQHALADLKDADPQKYRKVKSALQSASQRLEQYYHVGDPQTALIYDRLAQQWLGNDDPQAQEFAKRLGRQIAHVATDEDDAASGRGADKGTDGRHAEQVALASASRAPKDAGGLKQYQPRRAPERRVHGDAAETLSAEIAAADPDPVARQEAPAAGRPRRRADLGIRDYRPRKDSKDLGELVKAKVSDSDQAFSDTPSSTVSATPLALNLLQLVAFNRHKVELAKLAEDAGVDTSTLSRMLDDLTRTGVEDADDLLDEVADLWRRCVEEGSGHPENPAAVKRLSEFAGALDKDIREAIASGGKRDIASPPADRHSERVELSPRQLMMLQRHCQTLDEIARVTGHDDVAALSDRLDGLKMTTTRDDLNAALGQVLDVQQRYIGDSLRYTDGDEKMTQLIEKIYGFMQIIEGDIRAVMPDGGSNDIGEFAQ